MALHNKAEDKAKRKTFGGQLIKVGWALNKKEASFIIKAMMAKKK